MSNTRFLDTLHAENAEIDCQLGEMQKLTRALDTIGMDGLAAKIWKIQGIIQQANRNILDAYGEELRSEFVASQRSVGETIKSLLNSPERG